MLLPPWLQIRNNFLEVDGAWLGDAEKDNVWELQKPLKDWSSYDLAIYRDVSVKVGTETVEGGILPCLPTYGARPFKLKRSRS